MQLFKVKERLDTWEKMTPEEYRQRIQQIFDLFDTPDIPKESVVADVGSGPLGGMFFNHTWDTMYAVDPCFNTYKKHNLINLPDNVTVINEMSHEFRLPRKADAIFSVNAIDHSGNMKLNIANIMNNLKPGGTFYVHVHMRRSNQLDSVHRMVSDEKMLDNIFKPYLVLKQEIYDKDPLAPESKREKMTFMAHIKKN